MARVQEIKPDTESGVWTVVTRTSTYLLDLDEKTLLRAPGVGGTGDEEWTVSRLRRDSEDIPLLGVKSCRVGESAQFWVRAADDPDVRTWRITTPVVSIERIG
ncbi:hypothetical protein Gbro_2443 [Gordonia bronchialis DSM 43247]|uniref:Uncharacterized protein n=1 Tax=Gordonia bronchialis (strain ATCC 25592 / DSM 43247 / BCRC 13721 / JCM 3198 / KCTC 3076 / NBRC 16047 / NCTC 10667) TaxID=526226 RepID=D0LDR1_GORB4|nr:hypothetical protein [Gordonia bronchialis]ACY21684.1 hypothetical protein Gbro_2443 [Gordonia bronchialis DSM 43247]MCC3324471.1 hypothetical protein [Gordonia bronchialis]QGS24692.1 hypothetical protein FOB84_11570 [Gordonia bronchialis]UAK39056.1 hypothetical protein K8O93_04795 [Gordonia bronchialis]STQ64572.1 Uncharacterised protein [Gordonia bronchialis]